MIGFFGSLCFILLGMLVTGKGDPFFIIALINLTLISMVISAMAKGILILFGKWGSR